MGFMDKLPFGSNESDSASIFRDTMTTTEREEQLKERVEQLQGELQEREQRENADGDELTSRAAALEERQHEVEHENQQLKEQLQETRQELQQVQQQKQQGTMGVPAPENESLEGKPVVSSDGNQFFGLFVRWISNPDGKVGIECEDPNDKSVHQQVGWGDRIPDLVIDANRLPGKDVIIVKLDGRREPVDLVGIQRHKQVKKERDKLQDKASRFSREVDRLSQKKEKYKKISERLMVQLSMARMQNAQNHDVQKDVALAKSNRETDMLKGHLDTTSEKLMNQRGREDALIQEYEDIRARDFSKLGRNHGENLAEEFGEQMSGSMEAAMQWINQLPEEQQEAIQQSMNGGAGGDGMINIVEDE